MDTQQRSRRRHLMKGAIFFFVVQSVTAIDTLRGAQDDATFPPVDEKGNPIAHVCTPDCRYHQPCERTEAEQDPDVAKRPCFRQALHGRTSSAVFLPSDNHTLRVAPGAVPPELLQEFRTWLDVILTAQLRPSSAGNVEWYALGAYKPKYDTQSPLFGEWETGGASIVAQGLQRAGRIGAIRLSIRTTGPDRLAVRMPPEQVRISDEQLGKWEYVDKEQLRKALTRRLAVPFRTVDDFCIERKRGSVVEGVVTYGARLTLKNRNPEPRTDRAVPGTLEPWFNAMRVWLSDTDPQYFCVWIKVSGRP